MTTTTTPLATEQETDDLAALDRVEAIAKIQHQTISRRLLGANKPTNSRVVGYFTEDEAAAVKRFASALGVNVSTIMRIVMVSLAAAGLPSDHDPRLG